jgi:hypothetical protein
MCAAAENVASVEMYMSAKKNVAGQKMTRHFQT